jgi:dienelactone hydrolase
MQSFALFLRFFGEANQHGNRYHAVADRDSWPKVLAFFEKHLSQVPIAAN